MSVVIPSLNEEEWVGRAIVSVQEGDPAAEIVVADGGSTDRTVALAESLGVRVVVGPVGRGAQMNRGAHATTGELLLFLHADTLLPAEWAGAVAGTFSRKKTEAATFRLKFDLSHPLLGIYSWLTRINSRWTRFGDAGIVVRREFFERLGGFREWHLFEDVDFLARTRKMTDLATVDASVTTSARRFVERGIIRQQIVNGVFLFRFFIGADGEELARQYSGGRRDKGGE